MATKLRVIYFVIKNCVCKIRVERGKDTISQAIQDLTVNRSPLISLNMQYIPV